MARPVRGGGHIRLAVPSRCEMDGGDAACVTGIGVFMPGAKGWAMVLPSGRIVLK